jgi:predicted MFS family arabinose efflux permease
VLVGARLLSGAGEALFFVAAFAATVDLAPAERRGEAISFASLSLYLGIGVGPFLGEAAIGLAGFPGAWVLAIALGVAAALRSARLPALVPEGSGEGPRRLIDRRGLLPGLVLLSMVWGMAGFLAFVPLSALDLGMAGAGPVLGLFGAIVVGIRSLGARIPDRVGAGRTTRVSLLAGAAGLALAGLRRDPAARPGHPAGVAPGLRPRGLGGGSPGGGGGAAPGAR